MQKRLMLLPTAAALLVAALVAVMGGQAGATASSIDIVSIDAAVQGNTATSLGKTDYCSRLEVGSTLPVDIVENAIPADRPTIGFELHLMYDPQVVEVIDYDNDLILASNGDYSPFTGLSDKVPDADGHFTTAVIDVESNPTTGANMETGPGVLSRITLKAKAKGLTTLTLGGSVDQHTYPTILDDQNLPIQVNKIGTAAVAVGQACPSAPPQPIVTPLPNIDYLQTPQAVPSPSPNSQGQTPGPGTPDAQASPNASGTAGPGTPDVRTPSVAATATAAATATGQAQIDGKEGEDSSDSGFPVVWVVVGIVLGLGAAGGGGYLVYRRRASGE